VGFSRAENVVEARQRVMFGCCCEIIGDLNGFNNRRNGLVGGGNEIFAGGMDFLRGNRLFAGEMNFWRDATPHCI
jgi:hypothetical protein